MEWFVEHGAILRFLSEFLLLVLCAWLSFRYCQARGEILSLSRAGRSFIKGLPIISGARVRSAEGQSLIRLFQMSASLSRREVAEPYIDPDISLTEEASFNSLGDALVTAINNQALIKPKAIRIFRRKDGVTSLLSQQGLLSGRFGRVVFDIVEEHEFVKGATSSIQESDSLRAYGIRRQLFSRFKLPWTENEELLLWLGFEGFHLSNYQDHLLKFETVLKNLTVIISQFHKIEELERTIGDERDAFLGVSHDLKAPGITALYLIRELQSRFDSSNTEKTTYLDLEILILEQLALIHDYLDIERSRTNLIAPSKEVFDIEEFIEEIVESPLIRHGTKQSEFKIVLEGSGTIIFDRSHLKRIVLNLITNAFKYAKGTKIVLGVQPKIDGALELYVSDSGDGISQELAQRLFSKFQRLDAPTGISGSGLGLAASQLLAEKNGSILAYERRREGGSIFSIVLKRSEIIHIKPGVAECSVADMGTVLVVEDDEATIRLYTRILNAIGYQVDSQQTLAGARDKIFSGCGYRALISDFLLPDGDCFSLLKEMSKMGVLLPTLIISGMSESDVRRCQAREVMEKIFSVRFIEKPIERERLEREMFEMLETGLVKSLEQKL